jgi:hypothetical protein
MAKIIVAGDAVAADVVAGKKFSAGILYNETGTGSGGGIPEDVLTQLDAINGEDIGSTAYDKMDAIEASKADIADGINSLFNEGSEYRIDANTFLSSYNEKVVVGLGERDTALANTLSNYIDETPGIHGLQAEVARLDGFNTDIHDAIEAKGVSVDPNLESYPAAIASISGGGAPETITGTAQLRPSSDISTYLHVWPSGAHFSKVNLATPNDSDAIYWTQAMGGTAYDFFGITMDAGDTIPLGATITKVRVYARTKQNNASGVSKVYINTHNQEYRSTGHSDPADDVRRDWYYEWATNPYTSGAWTLDEINALRIGWEVTFLAGLTYICTQLYAEVSWTYEKLAQEIEATGVTVSQVAYDDGALQKGSQFVVIDNGDGTLSMPNRNLMIAKPFNMIDGADGAVNAQNAATLVNTTNYGTISLNTEYFVGTIGGVTPISSYVPYYWNPPYNTDALYRDTDGVVWKSTIDNNYNNPAVFPINDPAWLGWEQMKSHSNIYVCKTQHTTAAEPPMWNYSGQSYSVGDKITWSGMGIEYYECNTAYTSTGDFWSESANWTDVTAATIASAFVSANWVEVTNITTPMHLNKPIGFDFTDACAFANSLSFAGYTDWRLANMRELMDMMYFNNPASETSFPLAIPALGIVAPSYFRSSTPYSADATKAFVTDFTTYTVAIPGYNAAQGYVLCVRDIA